MDTISINYSLVWRFKNYPHIQIATDRKIYNTKTGRKLKITRNGGSIGVWVGKNIFITKSKINDHIEVLPKKQYCPF